MGYFEPNHPMRAVICDGVGSSDVMCVKRVERPKMPIVGSGQIMVRVHAAGVNRPDVLQRSGLYAPPVDASPILGLEIAGVVVGGDVNADVALGDAVCALTHGGGYAEYVVVERDQCLPVPNGWTMVEAASLPETYFTVWFNVFERAHLGLSGVETLLVHGGSSGIGVAAIQMARAMGQVVWASAGTAEKRSACVALGAAGAFDYKEDWVSNFLVETDGVGAHVILDMAGGSSTTNNILAMASGGRLAWIAHLTGNRIELKISDIMAREIQFTGSYLRRQTKLVKAQIAMRLKANIWPKLVDGTIMPVIDHVFDFENVKKAHERMESNQHVGKIVLQLV